VQPVYDNTRMRDLIEQARGERSISEYSRACGMSATHLSRIYTGTCRPTRKLCEKLAQGSLDKDITEKHFLDAAGYKNEELDNLPLSKRLFTVSARVEQTLILGVITRAFSECEYEFQLIFEFEKESDENNFEKDFGFKVKKDNVQIEWNFVRDARGLLGSTSVRMDAYYYYLGRLLSYEPQCNTQYTMLFSDNEMYERLKKGVDGKTIRASVSIALVDFETLEIIEEFLFGPDNGRLKL